MLIYFLIHLLTLFHKDMRRREKNRNSCDNREGGEDYQTEPEMFVFLWCVGLIGTIFHNVSYILNHFPNHVQLD